MTGQRAHLASPPRLLALALMALVAGFGVIPLGVLVVRVFDGALWGTVWSDAATRHALLGTLLTSSGAAAMALGLGLPLSVLLERTDLPLRRTLKAAFTLPTAVPPYIWCMGWIALANPKAGLLNRLWGEGTLNVYSALGIAFVLGGSGLPLVVLPTSAMLSRVDPSLEEAARICGAGPLRTLALVPVRLSLPAAASGAALVFLYAAASFGVPYLLGVTATPPTPTLTTRIYSQMLMGSSGLSVATALSVLLLMVAVAVLGVSQLLGRTGRVAILAGKGIKHRRLALGAWRWPLGALALATGTSLIAAPLLAVAWASLSTPKGTLTFAHWGRVLGDGRTLAAALNSTVLSLATAALVVVLGLGIALVRRTSARLGRVAELLAAWPYAVPGTVLAIALLVAFSRDIRWVVAERFTLVLALSNTLWLLLVGWVAKQLAVGSRGASEGLARVDPSLAEAARISGAGPARAFRDVVFPQLRAPLFAAFVLTFLTCATELTLAVLLVPPGRDVLGTLLFELQSYADPSSAAVIACAFVLLVLASLALVSWLDRREAAT